MKEQEQKTAGDHWKTGRKDQTMTLYETQKMLENHKHWLNHDCPGWEHMRADLSRQDLTAFGQMNLSGMDLRGAIMHETILDGAMLINTKLDHADLSASSLVNADMRGASLAEAFLNYADLSHADLSDADLHNADMCFAKAIRTVFTNADMHGITMHQSNLQNADLICANLISAKGCFAKLQNAIFRGATLNFASLYHSDLTGAELYGAILDSVSLCYSSLPDADLRRTRIADTDFHCVDLSNADFRKAYVGNVLMDEACIYGTEAVPFVPTACPDHGSFIGWKKASGKIVCLEIPADAKRSSATGRICRCNKANVLSITEPNGDLCDLQEVSSDYDKNFIYRVGETVSVKNFCEDRSKTSAPGIHFFINKAEAVRFRLP